MSGTQSRFLRFHENIKLGSTDENAILREKRDAILRRMRDRGLTFDFLNQGSYAMGTGVLPVDGDFDIDVGIILQGDQRPDDPLAAKRVVYDAVFGHTPNVEWRRNCIRVQYVRQGAATWHVDLPVYWKSRWSTTLSLAVGKQHSSGTNKAWQDSDPRGLITRVTEHGVGEDRWQFRRVVRYLKRWKDVHFPTQGNAAPVGIGITIAALNGFTAKKTWGATTSAGYDDLAATHALVQHMIRSFRQTYHEGEYAQRIAQNLPVQPYTDVFARITNQQMKEFKERLEKLEAWLRAGSADPRYLVSAFGSDFPA